MTLSCRECAWCKGLVNEACERRKLKPDLEARRKSSALIVVPLEDFPLRVCISKRNDQMAMLELLDKRYASSRSSSRISTLTSVFSTKYIDRLSQSMSKHINEFEDFFAQLEKMGADWVILESLLVPILLSSLDTTLESAIAALWLKESKYLTWEAPDLIQEFERSHRSLGSKREEKRFCSWSLWNEFEGHLQFLRKIRTCRWWVLRKSNVYEMQTPRKRRRRRYWEVGAETKKKNKHDESQNSDKVNFSGFKTIICDVHHSSCLLSHSHPLSLKLQFSALHLGYNVN